MIGEVGEETLKEMKTVCVEGYLHHTRSLREVRVWWWRMFDRAMNLAKSSDRKDRDTDRSLPIYVPLDSAAVNLEDYEDLFSADDAVVERGVGEGEANDGNISRVKLRACRLFIFAVIYCADEELLRSIHLIVINNMQLGGSFSARATRKSALEFRKALEARVDIQNEQLNSLTKMTDALKILQDFGRRKGEDLFTFNRRIHGAHASCIVEIKHASIDPAEASGADAVEPQQGGRAASRRRNDVEMQAAKDAHLASNWAYAAADMFAFVSLRREMTAGECPFFKDVKMEFDSLQKAITAKARNGLPGLTGNVASAVVGMVERTDDGDDCSGSEHSYDGSEDDSGGSQKDYSDGSTDRVDIFGKKKRKLDETDPLEEESR